MPAYLETTVHTSYKQLCQGAVLDYKLGNITEKSEMVGHCHMDSDRLAKQVVDLIAARLKPTEQDQYKAGKAPFKLI